MFFLILLLFLLVGGAVAVVTVLNLMNLAHLSLFGLSLDIPVGLLLLGAFVLGGLFLYIVSVLSALRDLREMRKLRSRVGELERQLMTSSSGTGPLPAPPMMPIPMPGMQSPPQN